jgi:hypothetical protein
VRFSADLVWWTCVQKIVKRSTEPVEFRVLCPHSPLVGQFLAGLVVGRMKKSLEILSYFQDFATPKSATPILNKNYRMKLLSLIKAWLMSIPE